MKNHRVGPLPHGLEGDLQFPTSRIARSMSGEGRSLQDDNPGRVDVVLQEDRSLPRNDTLASPSPGVESDMLLCNQSKDLQP